MVRTQVQLTNEQSRALKRLAVARGVSVAELIREGVQLLIATSGGAEMEDRIKRAIAAAGRFRSGVRDLATNHDNYLEESYK
ncbi:MAG TPA: CopG family transcriptional regulator [Firmicutes bacterium]|nr:CopG family transcriptional regulator [Bacillota bacterium]